MLNWKYKKYIFFIPTFLWMMFIFSFSLQPASKSELLSDGIGVVILEHSSTELREESDTWSYIEWRTFHRVIRKCGHLAEFFVLGTLMFINLQQTHVVHKKGGALILCAIVASIDETIQLFVPGRAGMIADVMLDCFGSLMGIWICAFIIGFILQKRKNHGYQKTIY